MKLLFITSNRLGDAVLSTGLLGHLSESIDVSTTVACGPVASRLFELLPGIDRVIPIAKRRHGGHWRDLWRQVVGTRWDLVVDLRASPMSYVIRARGRRIMFKAGAGHRVESLAAWYGVQPPPAPRIWSSAEHVDDAADLLPGEEPILGLAPTANWQGKIWPAERFVALAEGLTTGDGPLAGARIAVFGGPGEDALVRPVLDGLGDDRAINLVGGRHLLTVAECLRLCRLVVSNDSGLMHLAAASGAPTLGLFGPSRVEHYAPWGSHSASVTTEVAYDDLFAPDYDRHTTGSLMTTLSVDAVLSVARSLLERT
ncbi:MAG: glycosyltransferase family 9 protein [Rhodospirillales bacterium]|nr:glycosyltransferase family 9 protein [Rhodospirillales bacterium]